MRKRFPTADELVYDNYNFFVIGYCTGDRPSDCIFSLIADRKGMALSFRYGAALPDQRGIPQGAGDLARPEVAEMLQIAADHAITPLPENGKGKLVIRSVLGKQRPRR